MVKDHVHANFCQLGGGDSPNFGSAGGVLMGGGCVLIKI